MNRVPLLREIPGVPGTLAGSDGKLYRGNGKVRNMQPHSRDGYFYVVVIKNGKRLTTGVHRLVFSAFHGEISEGLTINHKNFDRLDNRPSNLEAVTISENIKKAWESNSPGVVKLRKEGWPNLRKAWKASKEQGHPHLKEVHRKQREAGYPNLVAAWAANRKKREER